MEQGKRLAELNRLVEKPGLAVGKVNRLVAGRSIYAGGNSFSKSAKI